MTARNHWDDVYERKQSAEVSWYQEQPALSLRLIERAGVGPGQAIIDVGGGASSLVDTLLARGYTRLTVLDISERAIAVVRERLGPLAGQVTWMVDDVTRAALPEAHYGLWHDRAAFHFLTRPEDRAAYVAQMDRAITDDGYAIIATFADDGPQRCSGLDVMRYSPAALAQEFAPAFQLVEATRDEHATPGGAVQRFSCALLRRVHSDAD